MAHGPVNVKIGNDSNGHAVNSHLAFTVVLRNYAFHQVQHAAKRPVEVVKSVGFLPLHNAHINRLATLLPS